MRRLGFRPLSGSSLPSPLLWRDPPLSFPPHLLFLPDPPLHGRHGPRQRLPCAGEPRLLLCGVTPWTFSLPLLLLGTPSCCTSPKVTRDSSVNERIRYSRGQRGSSCRAPRPRCLPLSCCSASATNSHGQDMAGNDIVKELTASRHHWITDQELISING